MTHPTTRPLLLNALPRIAAQTALLLVFAALAGVLGLPALGADGPAGGPQAGALQAGALQEIVIRVLPQPSVAGETFTLGEVAEFDGFDVPAIAELAKVQLGRSPLPGRSVFLNEPFIRSRLAGSALADRVRIEAPKGAQVVRAGQIVRAQDIEQLVKSQALKDSQAPADDVKLELLSALQDVQLPTGTVDWEVTQMGKNLSPSGDRSYQVSAKQDGRDAWRTLVRIRQKVYQTVVQAAKPIRRDQVIAAGDVTEVRKSMPAGRDAGFIGSAKLAIGMRANRPIGQDEAINETMLRAQVAVPEGGRVTLVFESGMLRLAAPGVALAQGQLGQFIPVRNLQSERIVHGIVQSDETVKVN
jgi:flagella basal body P-ring formation protein FlgA